MKGEVLDTPRQVAADKKRAEIVLKLPAQLPRTWCVRIQVVTCMQHDQGIMLYRFTVRIYRIAVDRFIEETKPTEERLVY